MKKFIDIDRETPMLLLCDLREWVPEDDMVHFVIESVEGMNLQKFKINERGTGSKQTVEPVFGIIKQCMGFRQFLLRGVEKVSGEWQLVTTAYNFKRLWNLKMATNQ